MSEKCFSRILLFLISISALSVLINIFIGYQAITDDLEHIHASWLVWNGQVPYKDFFEHHHPLMWYLFAPIVGMCNRNITVFFVIRGIMSLVSFATLYVVYRIIKDFISDRITGLLAISIYCASFVVQSALVQFKPDLFMQLFFMLGVYYFFRFIRDEKQKDLSLCAAFLTIGFLFLQTIIFLALPLGIIGIYLVYTKKIGLKMVAKAAVIPAVILFSAVMFLYFSGNLERYFQLNWVINSQMQSVVSEKITDFSDFYIIFAIGTGCSLFLLCKNRNIYVATLILCFYAEFLLRAFYFSPVIYYFKILLLYNSVIISLVLAEIYRKWKLSTYVVCLLLLLANLKFFTFENTQTDKTLTTLNVISLISKNTTQDDYVLNPPFIPLGIFNKDVHYYWFFWHFLGKLDETLYNYAEPFDINELIKTKKPKLVIYGKYQFSEKWGGKQFEIDENLLSEYYNKTSMDFLYEIKDK